MGFHATVAMAIAAGVAVPAVHAAPARHADVRVLGVAFSDVRGRPLHALPRGRRVRFTVRFRVRRAAVPAHLRVRPRLVLTRGTDTFVLQAPATGFRTSTGLWLWPTAGTIPAFFRPGPYRLRVVVDLLVRGRPHASSARTRTVLVR